MPPCSSTNSNGVVARLDHPDQPTALQRQPDLFPGAIEELPGFTAAVPHATFRVTTEAIHIDGVTVPAGQPAIVNLLSSATPTDSTSAVARVGAWPSATDRTTASAPHSPGY